MLKNHIENKLIAGLTFQLTESQQVLASALAGFIAAPASDTIFLVKGYAGTGKTTMISQLVRVLGEFGIRSVLLAPTGRAAKVLTGYTGTEAYTIHKKIYRQKTAVDGQGVFVLDRNLHRDTWFIVDEASMITDTVPENNVFGSGRLLDDLVEYVFGGDRCRLLLAGDIAQLPPVGLATSPALDRATLERMGFGVLEFELTDVVRQAEGSGILFNATILRKMITGDALQHGFFQLHTANFDDIERINGSDLVEKIASCYDKHGVFDTAVVTRSNKRANLFNNGIRQSVLYRDTEIAKGDLLMVVRNNYFWAAEESEIGFIANGDIAVITHIYGYENIYGFRFADVSLTFVDYAETTIDCKIILDTLQMETPSLSGEEGLRLYQSVAEDYQEIKNKREKWKKMKTDPYYNALQVKFAYAVTCHKAQGGQWHTVFADTGYLTGEMIDKEFLRWLYTAFTRPVAKLFLVNFDKRFFEHEKE